jgi:O-antigen ligase
VKVVLFFLYAYFICFHVSLAGMEILVWTLLLPAIYMSFRNRQFLWPQKITLIALGGLFLSALISFFININSADRFVDYIGEFRWILIFIVLVQYFNQFHQFINYRKLVTAGQVIVIIAGFYSFYQFFSAHDPTRPNVVFHYIYEGSPYFRPNSFFGLPTTYAYSNAMFFALSMAFFLRGKLKLTSTQKIIEKIYLIIAPINIFIAFTRAVWISFVFNTLVLISIESRKYFLRIFIVLSLSFVTFYASFSSFQNRINSIFDSSYVGNSNRIYLWKANLMMFADKPLFGHGFDNDRDRSVVDSYLNKLDQPNVMRNHAHSTYINFLSSLGIFGTFFFCLFVLYSLRTTLLGIRYSQHHLHKTLFLGILGAQIVLLMGGLTECTFEDSELTHQYLFYLALQEYLFISYIKPQIATDMALPNRSAV